MPARPAEPTLCRELRTKTMFYGFDREAALEVGPECGSASFWCAQTARPLGPDGESASRRRCLPGRDCFVG
ncbi:MAG TPA: hypothetical protein VKE69_06920 [Planctomycetota bacterium]|nr:hypothetical protein [Planctomycetota bacterium]